ncbi:hypothetical protein [Pedobacter sp. FW305-3-2-15-E-R2A2]|jgi:hypothetical protein|uniref:hypothetical protein n=1 Tax=Pedobacter sp. FW305-3-2-15-E-R2A2 TaxID=3140251 RepID=UPI00313FEE7C
MKTQHSKTQIQGALTKADLSKIMGGNSNPEDENETSAHKRISDVAPILIGGVLIGAAAQVAK